VDERGIVVKEPGMRKFGGQRRVEEPTPSSRQAVELASKQTAPTSE